MVEHLALRKKFLKRQQEQRQQLSLKTLNLKKAPG
jgi:hypothetical protein